MLISIGFFFFAKMAPLEEIVCDITYQITMQMMKLGTLGVPLLAKIDVRSI